jgi:tRNA threonylcarbamoyladenosine biosynthesis protein TsaB
MWLAIDTATDRASVALFNTGAATAWQEDLAGPRRHAAALLPMVESLLRRAGATLDDVTGIALSDGPGSFTGLRVGAAVAKALVHTRGLPLWVAPSLMVRAAGVAPEGAASDGPVLAVANALRGEVFAAAYRFRPGEVVTELAPSVRRPEELAQSDLKPALIAGDVPEDARQVLERWTGRSIIAPPLGAPHAARLIDLVGRTGGAVRVLDVPAWEPVYGRPAEAQVRWEKTHGRPLPDPIGRSG